MISMKTLTNSISKKHKILIVFDMIVDMLSSLVKLGSILGVTRKISYQTMFGIIISTILAV